MERNELSNGLAFPPNFADVPEPLESVYKRLATYQRFGSSVIDFFSGPVPKALLGPVPKALLVPAE